MKTIYSVPPSLDDVPLDGQTSLFRTKLCIVFKHSFAVDLPPKSFFLHAQQMFFDHNAYIVIVFEGKSALRESQLARAANFYRLFGLYRILFVSVERHTPRLRLYSVDPFSRKTTTVDQEMSSNGLSYLFPDYLTDLHGYVYTVVVHSVTTDPILWNGKIYGVEVHLMNAILAHQNASYRILVEHSPDDWFIERGRGDLMLTKMFLTGPSVRHLHAIPSFGGICVYVPAGDEVGLAVFFTRPFQYDIWLCLLGSIGTIALVKATSFGNKLTLNPAFLFGENLGRWESFGGWDRVLALLLSLLVLFAHTLYEGQILSLISLRMFQKHINTGQDLLDSDYHIAGWSTAIDFVLSVFPQLADRVHIMKPGRTHKQIREAMPHARVCMLMECGLRRQHDSQFLQDLSYVMRDNLIPLLKFIKFHPFSVVERKFRDYRQWLVESGFLIFYENSYQELHRQVAHKQAIHKGYIEDGVLNIETLIAIFRLYAFGMAASVLVFIAELAVYRVGRLRERPPMLWLRFTRLLSWNRRM